MKKRFIGTGRLFAMALMVIALSGCGLIRRAQMEEAMQKRQAELKAAQEEIIAGAKECERKFDSGEIKTHVAKAKCINEIESSVFQRVNLPYLDLINIKCASRLVGSEKLDEKKITEGEFTLQMAELGERLTNEARRRDLEMARVQNEAAYANAAQRQADASNTAATGNFLQGLSALQSKAPSVSTTNCMGVGAGVSCTSVRQ